MNRELWEKTVAFHGHACPGLAFGFMAATAASESPEVGQLPYGRLVCLTENDACGVDAIQVVLGCTLGKGNLVFRDTGKHAFGFYDRETGRSLRLVARDSNLAPDLGMEERIEVILNSKPSDLFEGKRPTRPVPGMERVFLTDVCQGCGEPTGEHRLRLQEGKKLCLDCFQEYDKRW
ncbi:MAG: FmdE family protein [Deltaproteobacteria bacterium]|jgi:formylmethanofuran dehydrogenase subunit E|nr:FmdE family protein [Deltaproteobacteria bacterium]